MKLLYSITMSLVSLAIFGGVTLAAPYPVSQVTKVTDENVTEGRNTVTQKMADPMPI